MIGNFDPQGGHDNIETAEIAKISGETDAFLQAKFHGDVADTRAKFIQKLLNIGALHKGFGFAMFDIVKPSEGSILVDEHPKDLMIVLKRVTNRQTDPPSIRIVTNETFNNGDVSMILAQDVTIDHEGDIQYFVDMIEAREGEIEERVAERDVMDGHISGGKCLAPLFWISPDMHVSMVNIAQMTPAYSVAEYDSKGVVREVIPFGTYLSLEDKIHGLEVAHDLFDEIKDKEPKARAIG